MITRNGLNLFRIALSNSCIDVSDFTNIENNTEYLTEESTVLTSYLQDNYTQGIGTGIEISGTFRATSGTFMPDYRGGTGTLNGTRYADASKLVTYSQWNVSTALNNCTNTPLYAPVEVSTLTIPSLLHTEHPNMLAQFNQSGISFVYPRCTTGSGLISNTLIGFQPLGVYGLSPDEDEYLYITLPKCFNNTAASMNIGGTFSGGISWLTLMANLGYSRDTESIDDYDLKSPVYNKKLCPLTIKWESNNGTIIITIAFKNSEAESITVNEFGIYASSKGEIYQQPINIHNKVSKSGYKVGYGSTYYYDTQKTLGDYVYVTRGLRPNLIARKVLPQTVTIPAGGVATFKYTIDLSEMQAQENITYSEEE